MKKSTVALLFFLMHQQRKEETSRRKEGNVLRNRTQTGTAKIYRILSFDSPEPFENRLFRFDISEILELIIF